MIRARFEIFKVILPLISFGSIFSEKSDLEAIKKTVLYPEHIKLKAKMTNFGGWEMPVFYESVLAEHHAVRKSVGLFDVSHMGEIRVKGKNAEKFLNFILANDVSRLALHQGQYSAMCNEKGGIIDDLILYKLNDHEFFLCVNAGNIAVDFQWILKQSESFTGVEVRNESESWSQIALQGPQSFLALCSVLSKNDLNKVKELSYMHILPLSLNNGEILVARTGYTGELGYELYTPNDLAQPLWSQLIEKNKPLGIKPIGLGARDTLRLEVNYLLHGNDMDESVSPIEAGISWSVKFSHDFIGKPVLEDQKTDRLNRKLMPFKMLDSGIPRHGMYVLQNKQRVGIVTSGSVLPSVGGAGGLALILLDLFDPKLDISIDIRGQEKLAKVENKPFYEARVRQQL